MANSPTTEDVEHISPYEQFGSVTEFFTIRIIFLDKLGERGPISESFARWTWARNGLKVWYRSLHAIIPVTLLRHNSFDYDQTDYSNFRYFSISVPT